MEIKISKKPIDYDKAIRYLEKKVKSLHSKKTDELLLKTKVFDFYNLLSNSKRPIILVGNGVRSAKAIDLFLKLDLKKMNSNY